MSVTRIRTDIMPVRQAIAALEAEADKISGLVVLVSTNNERRLRLLRHGQSGEKR